MFRTSKFLIARIIGAACILLALSLLPHAVVAQVPELYTETINANVECEHGTLDLSCSLTSTNYSLVHLPSNINISDPHLINCTNIAVYFGHDVATLTFTFNDTNPSQARSNGDALIPSMDTAFNTTFIYNSTILVFPPDKIVAIIYSTPPKPDMGTFLGDLKSSCFASGVAGFSNALPTMFAHAMNETISLNVINYSSGWSVYFTAEYDAILTGGTGTHTIDVLYYLGTSVLTPSPYSLFMGSYFFSTVIMTINSNDTITLVSCQPANVSTPFQLGWFVTNPGPGHTLSGTMYFGNIPSVDAVTFAFSGAVVPEFSALTLMLSLAIVSMMLLYVRKRARTSAQPHLFF